MVHLELQVEYKRTLQQFTGQSHKCKPNNSHCITPLLHCSVHTPQAAVLPSHIPSLPVVSDGLPCCLQGTHTTVTGNVSQHMSAWVCHQMLQQVRVSVNRTTRWGCCDHALQKVTDVMCHNTKCESVTRCSNKDRVLDSTRKFHRRTCHSECVQAHFRQEGVFALTSAMLSAHAILMRSTVAGLSKGKSVVAPQSLLQTVTSHCVM